MWCGEAAQWSHSGKSGEKDRMKLNRLLHTFVGILVALLLATSAFAQSDNANVSGIVKDPSGAVIANAKVTLKNQDTGLVREAATNESGVYSIPTVPPGTYSLSVEATGFKKYESTGNKVDPSVPANISAVLQVGALTETVEVTATMTALQTESGALGRIVEGKQMQDLQLNGRNPIYLALLKPGVRGSSLAGFSYSMTTAGLRINGARDQDNLITYDGAVAVRTRSNGTSIGSADLDTTAEVQILTASYGAEYGRSAGGQVRVITKSGTRDLHASFYEYLRNNNMDANSWSRNRSPLTNSTSPMKFNQFGFNVGGPVFIPKVFNTERNKLFFTYAEEWAKQRSPSSNWRTVPSAKMKKGDFSELLTSSFWFKDPQILTDPSTGSPFPGNVIPTARQSANGMALLKVYPDPNGYVSGTSNYWAEKGSPTDQRKDSFGVDFLPSEKDNIRWRGMLYHYHNNSPWASNFLLSDQLWNRPNQTTSLNWTHTFTPTLILEAIATASRDQVYIGMQDTTAFNRTTYGINYPYMFGADSKDRPNKLPAVDLPTFSGYTGSPYPSQSTGPIYTLGVNVTKIVSNHTLKAGMALERSGQNDYDQINVSGVPGGTNNQNGRFVFSNTTPNSSKFALGNMALGIFDTYAEIGKRSYTPYRGHMVESFVQDEWKATSKLKVIYGVRWSVTLPYYSLWNNMAIFDPAFYDKSKEVQVNPTTGNPIPNTGDKYNGVSLAGDGWPSAAKGRVGIAGDSSYDYLFRGVSRGYSNIDWSNVQPRLGIAYQITPKTVVRTGAGKYSTRVGVSDSIFLGGNPPLQPIAAISYGSVDNPGGGSASSFPLSINTQAKDFPMPASYNWNATVEREVGFNTVVGLSYVGRRGVHGQREKNINQLPIGTLLNAPYNENYYRPYKGFGAIRETFNDANSMYNSMQVEVTRRFSQGFSYGLAYTLSQCKDDGSAQRDVIPDAYDASFLWGPCTYDSRHVAVINFIYQLPFFRTSSSRIARAMLGGWQMTGVMQFETGTPFSVQTSDDFAKIGSGSGNNITYFWKYANYGKGADYPKKFRANSGGTEVYMTVKDSSGNSLFTKPTTGTMVKDRIRDYFYNPGWQNWNLGLFKEFAFTEKQKLLFRAEAFNWLNHPNWSGMDTNPNNSTFGAVTNKNSERNLQLSLRYSF
jgi:hypothetical protein